MLNRELRTRLDILKQGMSGQVRQENEPSHEQQKQREAQEKQKKYYGGRTRVFEEGEEAMVADYRSLNQRKWSQAKIEKRIGRTTYLCRTKEGKLWKRHVNQIHRRGQDKKFGEEMKEEGVKNLDRPKFKYYSTREQTQQKNIEVDQGTVSNDSGDLLRPGGGNSSSSMCDKQYVSKIVDVNLPSEPNSNFSIDRSFSEQNNHDWTTGSLTPSTIERDVTEHSSGEGCDDESLSSNKDGMTRTRRKSRDTTDLDQRRGKRERRKVSKPKRLVDYVTSLD